MKGKTIGIDATTLEANAALRSIVRRDTGESYQEFLTKLAEASGIKTPTRAVLARLDRKRKKKGASKDWTHPHDPDARITKMKDGRTHLAHKAEHAVDLDTGAIVVVTVQGADQGDTTTIDQTLAETVEQLITVEKATDEPIQIASQIVADKGYHSRRRFGNSTTWASAPTSVNRIVRRRAGLINMPSATRCTRIGAGFTANAVNGLLRKRGELLERPNAHLTTRVACGERTCGVTTTSSSDCWCTRGPATLGSGCVLSAGSARSQMYRVGCATYLTAKRPQ